MGIIRQCKPLLASALCPNSVLTIPSHDDDDDEDGDENDDDDHHHHHDHDDDDDDDGDFTKSFNYIFSSLLFLASFSVTFVV